MAIFKLFKAEAWESFKMTGVFKGSPDDLRDGFIHFSTDAQLIGTLEKYYNAAPTIIIAQVDNPNWGDKLKWEVSRAGAKFPHLYIDLHMKDVIRFAELNKAPPDDWDLSEIERLWNISFAAPSF